MSNQMITGAGWTCSQCGAYISAGQEHVHAMETTTAYPIRQPLPEGFPDVISDETARRLLDLVFGTGEVAQMVQRLKAMTNRELAGLLVDHVWCYLPGGSPQSKLMDEVIDRLQGPEEWTDAEIAASEAQRPKPADDNPPAAP